MPYSSSDISAMNAQYMGMQMQQQQNASMIGAGMPLSDSLVGGGMNRAAAIGAPVTALGLGLAGLDPLSMGIRGAMAGSRFGLMGAAGMGLGAAGVAGGAAMIGSYAANQFFTGAQQQQQFGQMMNSTFRFANSYGGTGFGRSGNGDIGSMMRQMSTEQGPMGQMTGFEELGRLASNMGRMGMAQGVRDAKEFSDKFREMVKTVKQIAESMGTSLEEAQKMMGAMRSSGVFGQNQAASFASRVRQGAAAGGMATSELTGMMSVGSQISRMVGGRGRAGAAAGLETITNIGVAQQLGLISEEDIYNTTGLTGAEGRRAMATRQLEQSAQFLQGSLGRRFMASIAGKNGTIDESAVARYMAGGVGTEDTINMYNKNLSKVGRANFIRNEGKMRGATLERFGGLVPMMAMKNWLDERGINPNEDNDRAMIFMQRQLGMGNDEAEMMLRQVRELPQLMRQRTIAGEDDSYRQRIRERDSHSGLEGIKHKFEKAKADVNSALQQAGADFYQTMSGEVDSFINRLTDTYVKETRQDVAGAFRAAMSGGAMGAGAASTTFGIGNRFRTASSMKGLLSGGMGDMDVFNKTDAERFTKAGFGFSGPASGLMGHLGKVSQIVGAAGGGGAGLQDLAEVQMLGASAKDAFRGAMMGSGTMAGTRGMNRLAAFGTFLRGQAGMGGLADRYAAADDVEKSRILAAFSSEKGANVSQLSGFNNPELRGVYGTSGMHTLGEGAWEVGAAFTGSAYLGKADELGLTLTGGTGMFNGIRSLLNGGSFMAGAHRADRADDVGKFLLSDSGRSLTDKMMSDNDKVRSETREQVEKEIIQLQDKDKLTKAEEGRMMGLQGLVASQRLTEMEVNGASKEEIEAEKQRIAKEQGISVSDVQNQWATIGALSDRNRKSALDAAGERYGARARESLVGLVSSGLVDGSGGLVAKRASALGGSSAGAAFVQAMVEQQQAIAKMGPGADNEALMKAGLAAGGKMNEKLSGMSVAEQRKLAEGLSMVSGAEDEASRVGLVANVSGSLKRSGKGDLSNAASMLGANFSKEEMSRLVKQGGVSGAARAIAGRIGDGSLAKNADFIKDLEASLGSIQGGKFSEAGVKLSGLLGNETVGQARIQAAKDADPVNHLKDISKSSQAIEKKFDTVITYLGEMKGAKDAESQ